MPFRLLALFSVLVVVLAAPAGAEGWPQPNAAYSAVRTIKSGGMTMTGRIHHDHGKERWEVTAGGMAQATIQRPDLKKYFMVMPQMSMAMEVPLDQGSPVPTVDAYAGPAPEKMGRETVNGEATTKFRSQGDDGRGPYTVFFWVTDDGIPMRMEGSSSAGQFEMYLEDLQRGPQDAALFEVPPGFQVMPANPAMLGGGQMWGAPSQ